MLAYCARHPLSRTGWRQILATTVVLAALGTLLAASVLLKMFMANAEAIWIADVFWFMVHNIVLFARLALPLAVLGAAAEDLRRDAAVLAACGQGAPRVALGGRGRPGREDYEDVLMRHTSTAAANDALAWRALRVRQHLVLDMTRIAAVVDGPQLLLGALQMSMSVLLLLSEALILVTRRRQASHTALLLGEAVASGAILWLVLDAHHWPVSKVLRQARPDAFLWEREPVFSRAGKLWPGHLQSMSHSRRPHENRERRKIRLPEPCPPD
ncbi:hypothetical protein ONE63_004520 [Megalurothrips usitatus]|uniref:Uncharacterized protein n=1 Tax=Megalurothrips usitatus TaxID=439358 RepID=A0AAV7X723_9NEOP|nr:hypothetical protein ONE63_004520 [Megalurothrips usitatus]